VDTTRKPRPGIQKLYQEMIWGSWRGGGGSPVNSDSGEQYGEKRD